MAQGVEWAFLASPASFAALVDISLMSTTADNDFRAVYGGVSLGLALFFLASLSRPAWFRRLRAPACHRDL